MAKYNATLSAQNTSILVCNVSKPRNLTAWIGTGVCVGTFGGGTVTFQGSFNAGVTKFDLRDISTGTVANLTAPGMVNLQLGNTDTNSEVFSIYATIATATTPTVNISILDNN